jgi:dipeptidyl-peptidase 4
MRNTILLISFLLACNTCLHAQTTPLGPDQYFKNNFKDIIQPLPTVGRWLDDNQVLLTRDGKTMVLDCKKLTETPFTESAINKGTVENKPMIVTKENNLYWRKNVEDVQLTFDGEKKNNPTVSPDGNYVAFTRKNDLYTVNLNTKKEIRLTNDGNATILNGYASWVYMEEILGRASQYRAFWWRPDSKQIAFFRSDEAQVPVFTMTDAPGTHGVVETMRYPKAGDPNPAIKIGLVSPDGGATAWADFNERDDQYFGMPSWRPDSQGLFLPWMNRGQDKLIIYEINTTSGAKKEIYTETQKTWINLDDTDRLQFINGGKQFLIVSDKSGWKNIYLHDISGKEINIVAGGQLQVLSIDLVDEKSQTVFFRARTPGNSARAQFYRASLNGKEVKQLTTAEVSHDLVYTSPNGSYFLTRNSNVTTPYALTLFDRKGKMLKEIANTRGKNFATTEIAKTQFVRVKSEDGKYDLPMKVIWPLNMDKSKKYPVLISIYGGPDAGNCWDIWQLTGQQQWMAKEGLIQVVMDHRASGHFGKEGVNYMHRNLGYWEMKDYSTMAQWLIANAQADPKKIAITGFSYGGYVSCYALTYGANIFTHAMAGGSVTDWTLYDSHYTERLMDTPAENPEGYKSSSVFTHADKYKGVLQLVHGVIDDNVHMQNSIQLLSKLQDLKKDVEFMIYSGGRHGWRNLPARDAHYNNLKTKFIYQHLLEKPVPKEALR